MAPRSTTEKTHAPDGSLTISEINRREAAFFESQQTVTRCGVDGCGWTHDGTLQTGRAAFIEHRGAAHSGAGARLRKRRAAA